MAKKVPPPLPRQETDRTVERPNVGQEFGHGGSSYSGNQNVTGSEGRANQAGQNFILFFTDLKKRE